MGRKLSRTLAERLGYSIKDVLVIVNIDDVGLHKDETSASFSALNCGMVKSGSIMATGPNFEEATKLYRYDSRVDLGIHLTLTCEWGEKLPWKTVLAERYAPSLYNPEGRMWGSVGTLLAHARLEEIEKELEAQIRKVLDLGLDPSHLDYHMNCGYPAKVFPIIMKLSKKYNLSLRVDKRRRMRLPLVRNNLWSLRRKGYVFPDTRKGIYMVGGDEQSLEKRRKMYHEHLRSLKSGVHCIQVHMAFATRELEDIMGIRDTAIRQIDYDVWTCDETKMLAEELGILFISFRPLQALQKGLMKNSINIKAVT
jgi:chitin disaccharide deacetylase